MAPTKVPGIGINLMLIEDTGKIGANERTGERSTL